MWLLIAIALMLAWLGQPILALLLLAAAGTIAYDVARRSSCSSCFRPFAVWRVKGRPLGWRRVCRRCHREHRQLRRAHAR